MKVFAIVKEVGFFKSTYFVAAIVLVWAILAIGGYVWYAGSALAYVLFSIVFLTLLLDGLYRPISLGYSFLVVFMWLGFWLKLISHLWLDYPFREPIGYFDGSPEAWDTVLNVSSVGALGVMWVKAIFCRYSWQSLRGEAHVVPSWYLPARSWIWLCAVITIIFLCVINALYGIARSGLVPLNLPWPLTGLMSWFLSFGLAIILATLVYWDHISHKGWKIGFLGVFGEAFLSGYSSLSKAVFIFHTIPYLMVLFKERLPKGAGGKKIRLIIVTVFLALLATSLILVVLSRYMGYADSAEDVRRKLPERLGNVIVDRWVGLEGVMAVSAYPHQGVALFSKILQEKRIRGKVDFYTKEISKAGVVDSSAYQYASIPGGVAFFYYTGSLWVVLIGMACLTSVLMASERLVLFLTQNPYICAFWSMGGAQFVASFGLGVRQAAIYYLTCFISMGAIWLVQKTAISPSQQTL